MECHYDGEMEEGNRGLPSPIPCLIYAFPEPSRNKQINKVPVLRTPLLPIMYLSRKHFHAVNLAFLHLHLICLFLYIHPSSLTWPICSVCGIIM